jgi:tetrapyrrole methylase family protein/MazG family protein
MVKPPENLKSFSALMQIVEALRGPEGCPWDKEQTHRSLTPFAIEEAHELAEAIEGGQKDEMIGELGDLLLQVALHSEIGRGAGEFEISDVINSICEKMVRRHPHVFTQNAPTSAQMQSAKTSGEVLTNWAEIKDQEKKHRPEGAKDRFDVSPSLPALVRAQKIGGKTKRRHFDWNTPEEVLLKVEEEFDEVSEEMARGQGTRTAKRLEHEIGDLLFSTAQLARHLGLDAEQCLRSANQRFEKRFFTMTGQIKEKGIDFDSLSLPELEEAWTEAKMTLKDSES